MRLCETDCSWDWRPDGLGSWVTMGGARGKQSSEQNRAAVNDGLGARRGGTGSSGGPKLISILMGSERNRDYV